MERPEVKAQIEESRKANDQIREREYAMVYKAMDRRQVSNFKKMLGKPFDVSLLTAGAWGGRRGGNDAAAAKSANGQAPSTEASAKAEEKPAPAASKPAAPRRQSLRERRGLGQQPSQPSPN
jgi:hypothetical protein